MRQLLQLNALGSGSRCKWQGGEKSRPGLFESKQPGQARDMHSRQASQAKPVVASVRAGSLGDLLACLERVVISRPFKQSEGLTSLKTLKSFPWRLRCNHKYYPLKPLKLRRKRSQRFGSELAILCQRLSVPICVHLLGAHAAEL